MANTLLQKTIRLVSSLKLEGLANSMRAQQAFSKMDIGVLKVTMLVAALDGNVTREEFKAFDRIAKFSRGYSENKAARVMDDCIRATGYLELQAKRLKSTELIRAFIKEAELALPQGFIRGSAVDLRRAFVMWVAMAMADGEYSAIERAAITSFRDRLAAIMQLASIDVETSWRELSPAFAMTYCGGKTTVRAPQNARTAPTGDFLNAAAKEVALLQDEKTAPAAMKRLKTMIQEGLKA